MIESTYDNRHDKTRNSNITMHTFVVLKCFIAMYDDCPHTVLVNPKVHMAAKRC